MELCSEKHEEVCFEGRECPVCFERDDLQSQIDDLNKEITGLKDEIIDFENQRNG